MAGLKRCHAPPGGSCRTEPSGKVPIPTIKSPRERGEFDEREPQRTPRRRRRETTCSRGAAGKGLSVLIDAQERNANRPGVHDAERPDQAPAPGYAAGEGRSLGNEQPRDGEDRGGGEHGQGERSSLGLAQPAAGRRVGPAQTEEAAGARARARGAYRLEAQEGRASHMDPDSGNPHDCDRRRCRERACCDRRQGFRDAGAL